MIVFDTAQVLPAGPFVEPVRIYTGLLGQIGDIIAFTATARRIKEIFPNSTLTWAVSRRYREAGTLVSGLPYVDRVFETEFYFERCTNLVYGPWSLGWPADLAGNDEIAERRKHDIILETRPRHRRMPWWEFDHLVAELAHQIGVPGPIDLRTEISIPPGTEVPPETTGRYVLHNDPSIDPSKAWPWEFATEFVSALGSDQVVLLGNPGPVVPGALDYRGRTTLAQAAAIMAACRCYIGIDSGLMWIAGSLGIPTVGLYGTSYIPAYQAVQPINPRAVYLQVEGMLSGISVEVALQAIEQALRMIRI